MFLLLVENNHMVLCFESLSKTTPGLVSLIWLLSLVCRGEAEQQNRIDMLSKDVDQKLLIHIFIRLWSAGLIVMPSHFLLFGRL